METKENKKPMAPRRSAPKRRPAKEKDKAAVTAKKPESKPRSRPEPKPRRRDPSVEIVYTPPKPLDKRKLLLRLGIVVAVVLAVFFSLSLFFKVSEHGVMIAGNNRYSADVVKEASGIHPGDSLLSLNKARISSQIITKLPYVNSVRIGIKLPGTVNIEIEELAVVYAISETDGSCWLMGSNGRLVEKTDAAAASVHPTILGVNLESPVVGQQAIAKETAPETTLPEGETVPVTITAAQKLQTVLAILQHLEKNNVLGDVVTVDVSDMSNLKLHYGDRFIISLGEANDLYYKIQTAIRAINQLEDYDRGALDVSFIIRDDVIYTPVVD